jgi:hypothetical protein
MAKGVLRPGPRNYPILQAQAQRLRAGLRLLLSVKATNTYLLFFLFLG